jgi:transcriptional regulator with GAF, ATPase, and Fis domain
VRAAITEASGNISKAAQLLKVTRHQMDYRLKKMTGMKAKGIQE